MSIRRLHRFMGLVLLLPFLAWSITGMIFFIKPGFSKAYESLQLPNNPLKTAITLPAMPDAFEMRLVETVLGTSLLVLGKQGWRHLDPQTLQPKPQPDEADLRRLIEDAMTVSPARYGAISHIEDRQVFTSTGVRIKLDWSTLRLSQYGRDTNRIDWFYRIHYLQWTGQANIDRVLGILGLVLVMAIALTGTCLLLRPHQPS